jgi:RNase H-fold protein (predicted Holliday junction resolvase)
MEIKIMSNQKDNSAEAKALQRIANPIREEDWVTIGTLDEEFDMEEIARKVRESGYNRKVSNIGEITNG